MKAITQDRYGSADVLQLTDVDRPSIGKKELLVRVEAAGVDRGAWHLMTGRPYLARLGLGLRRPRNPILGMDLAGRVEAVGEAARGFAAGDEVFGAGRGSFAEYAVVRADRCAIRPANLTAEQAAALPVSAVTALQALRDQGRVRAGQRVLVIGAGGGVGTFAVQMAKAFGAHVTGVCSTAKVDLVRSLGADEVIDYTRQDLAGVGERYDVVLDIAGNRPLGVLRGILAPRGTLVIVGGEGGGRWLGGLDRQLRAVLLSPFLRQRLRMFVSITRRADLETVREMVESGTVRPVVDRTYPLADAAEALRQLESGRVAGKVVVRV